MKKIAGVGLLELLLVLALAAIIILISLRTHFLYQKEANVQTVLTNVEMIKSAARIYYSCTNPNHPAISNDWQSINVLKDYLPKINFLNPFGSDTYYIKLLSLASGVVTLQVELRLGAQYNAQNMQALLQGTSVDPGNNAVVWQGLPAGDMQYMSPIVAGRLKFFRNTEQRIAPPTDCIS